MKQYELKHSQSLKLILLCLTLLILIAGCTSQKKIAVVDMKKIVENSTQVQSYQQNLDKKLQKLQQEYETKIEDITDKEKLEEKRQEAYEKSQKIKSEMESKLKEDIQEAIEKVAKKEGIDVVLRNQDIKYGGINITEKVIKIMEE